MLLPSFEYARPESVDEAIAMLSEHRNARVLGGGQTLLNALKLRLVQPDVLVDVTRLADLHRIELGEDETLVVGAAVTYDEFFAHPLVRQHHPVTATMVSSIVDRQVRARGTIGGNVCLADPTGNFPPLLMAMGARLDLQGPEGPFQLDIEDVYLAPYMTVLKPNELLVAIRMPLLGPDQGIGFESLQVGIDSWALARACALVRYDGKMSEARLVLGCGPVPIRQPAMEEALIGSFGSTQEIEKAAIHVGEGFEPPSDVHASAEYRTEMARLMACRAIASAVRGASGHGR